MGSLSEVLPDRGLDAVIGATRGRLQLALTLDVNPGHVVAILGPNGAGKTTALHALAGLIPLSHGQIRVGQETWSRLGRSVPAHQRRVGLLAADHLLFPHLTAEANVAYGPQARGIPQGRARARANEELDRLGIGELAQTKPLTLSHGQAQRVALARALATDPAVLLLDEPLSALDPETRPSIRADLAKRLRDFPGMTVMVTHDPLDALTLADHLIFLDEGRVVQEGSPADIVERPRDRYVARVAGLNLIPGEAKGSTTVRTDHVDVVVANDVASGSCWIAFSPNAVSLFPARPDGSPRNTWSCTVRGIEHTGQSVRVLLEGPVTLVAEITIPALTQLRLQPGMSIWASVKATDVRAYPS